ncbi:MAG: C39 family peptidase [Acidobacteriota bacterium]|nr:C39 family peptidase [Acidobacteriota bacterium]
MRRHHFLKSAAVAVALPSISRSAQNCTILPPGVQICDVSVQPPLQRVSQQCPLWCWAASISAIFDFYGHPVPQQAIVQRVFGGVVCAASGSTTNIGAALSVNWVDANGNSFQSRVISAYDPANGLNTLNNQQIIQEITNNRPMLYCNTHHAMVVVGVRYSPSSVQMVGVTDPWPYSPPYHPLSGPEMAPSIRGGQMTFLAAVSVS